MAERECRDEMGVCSREVAKGGLPAHKGVTVPFEQTKRGERVHYPGGFAKLSV